MRGGRQARRLKSPLASFFSKWSEAADFRLVNSVEDYGEGSRVSAEGSLCREPARRMARGDREIRRARAAGQGVRARLICAQAHIVLARTALLSLFIDPQSGDAINRGQAR